MNFQFKDGIETVKLDRGEESAIDKVIDWLKAAAMIPARFPTAQPTLDGLRSARGHVDKAPADDAKGK